MFGGIQIICQWHCPFNGYRSLRGTGIIDRGFGYKGKSLLSWIQTSSDGILPTRLNEFPPGDV